MSQILEVKDIKILSWISLLTTTEYLELLELKVTPIVWEHLNETDGKKLEKSEATYLKQRWTKTLCLTFNILLRKLNLLHWRPTVPTTISSHWHNQHLPLFGFGGNGGKKGSDIWITVPGEKIQLKKVRHLVTRLAAHDFNHKICSTKKFCSPFIHWIWYMWME